MASGPKGASSAASVRDHYGIERTVAAHGLGRPRHQPIGPLDDESWNALITAARQQLITGALNAAVSDGALRCTDAQAAEARADGSRLMFSDLLIEARLAQTAAMLQEAGLLYRALKGRTTAARVYPDLALRSFTDVDVVVQGASFDRAVELLENQGGRRRYPQARAGFDRRFSKGASFSMPDGVPIDLHRTFVLGPFGFTVDLPGVFARCDVVTVGGRPIDCLEIHDATVHASMHAALGDWPPRLVPMRDIAHFLLDDRVDHDIVLARAEEWRCLGVVARAIDLTQTVLDIELPLRDWAAAYRPSRMERRAIEAYGAGRSSKRLAFAAIPFIDGASAKLSYVRDLAFPDPSYLGERDGSTVSRLLRGVNRRA